MAPLTSTGASKPTYTAPMARWTQWTEWTQWVQRTQCKHIIYRTATIGGRARRVGRSGPIKGVCMDWYIKGYQSMHTHRGVHEASKQGVQQPGVHEARYNSEGHMKGGTGWLHMLPTLPTHVTPPCFSKSFWKLRKLLSCWNLRCFQ